MSNIYNYGFRNFCISNFPFLEKNFDALTDYELICKIFEYFEDKINSLDEKYSDILDLRTEFEEFKTQINNLIETFETNINKELEEFETNINNDVDIKLQQNYNQVIQLLSEYQKVFNSELATLRTDLENEIKEIELGNVMAYNPTNGEVENVSKVIMDVYDVLRVNAITCTEFDSLELTANGFDEKQITAYNFDVNAKIMLNVA